MNQQENTVSVNDTSNAPQVTEQTQSKEKNEVRKHYLHHQLLFNPDATPELSDDAWLINFKRRAERFAEMLEFLERSWAEDIPALQKACFSYLTGDNIPRKERQQVIEAWTSWSDFLFALNRYRTLASVFLKYHQRMIEEIESLLTPATPELQATNQEGGIEWKTFNDALFPQRIYKKSQRKSMNLLWRPRNPLSSANWKRA